MIKSAAFCHQKTKKGKTVMNKTKKYAVVVFTALAVWIFSPVASAYNWYFKAGENGSRPLLCPEADFADKYDVIKIGEDEKKVYLTFDAGYENGNVEKTLDILKDNDVKGTFFVLPHLVRENTDLCIRMKEEGHIVGNHTVSHCNMAKNGSLDFFIKETQPLEELFYEKTGHELDKYFRPPEGAFSEDTLKNATQCGYTTVFWSLAYADWDEKSQKQPEKALELLLSRTHNGCVVLLHPTSTTNALILDSYIKKLKAQGYEFCLVSDIK